MDEEQEIRKELEPIVEKHLELDSWNKRKWKPAQFFDFMKDEVYQEELQVLRKRALGLPDDILVVVVGSMITEEGLPNYAARGGVLGKDGTGISSNPWSRFYRWWNAEENQHGDALRQYLLLSGRVNMGAIDISVQNLNRNGFEQEPNMYQAIFYPMVQEPIARTGHLNTAKLAKEYGDTLLEDMCKKIGADETRHTSFYMDVGKKLFSLTPEESVIQFASLMKKGIEMPSRLMADERYKTPPTLYNHFTDVAIQSGMFTPVHYANILDSLNESLGIESLNLAGEADIAQGQLLRIPGLMRKAGDRRAKETHTPVPFDWIYERTA